MTNLAKEKCQACNAGAEKLTDADISNLIKSLSDWQLDESSHIKKLKKGYTFKNFVQALAFTNQIAQLAENEFHHPSILTEWGKVTVTWWSHSIKGLHKNDFIMAAKTDELLTSS